MAYDRVNPAIYVDHPQAGTAALRAGLMEFFDVGDAGIVRDRERCIHGNTSEHCEGRAWDARVRRPDDPEGWRLAVTCVQYNVEWGVQSVIYAGKVWGFGDERWHAYGGPNPHHDHVHIGQTWRGARQLSLARVRILLRPAREVPDMIIVFEQTSPARYLIDAEGRRRHIANVETYRAYLDAGAIEKLLTSQRVAAIPEGPPIT